ncbi:hypothetical protein [uncultured Ruminococcus sp.]|uniref:hypothetical protein n=1 Tax=uncultured Ruminococcus sp. TaxID=165186 RepID=UPI0025D7364D|nr:hypothetical protein [uncultured Ruminococcus sp.]
MNFPDILHEKDNIVQKNGSLRENIKNLPPSVYGNWGLFWFSLGQYAGKEYGGMDFSDILHGKDNIVQKNGSLKEDIKVLPLSVYGAWGLFWFSLGRYAGKEYGGMNFPDILHEKDNIVQKNGSLKEDIKVLPPSVMHLGAILV